MKKGFTLVELLAVLVVLAIVAGIATTTILKEVNSSKNQLSSEQMNIVKSAAIEYATNKGYAKTTGSTYNVYLSDLKTSGLVNESLVSSLDKTKNYYVTLTVEYKNNLYYFSSSDLKS